MGGDRHRCLTCGFRTRQQLSRATNLISRLVRQLEQAKKRHPDLGATATRVVRDASAWLAEPKPPRPNEE